MAKPRRVESVNSRSDTRPKISPETRRRAPSGCGRRNPRSDHCSGRHRFRRSELPKAGRSRPDADRRFSFSGKDIPFRPRAYPGTGGACAGIRCPWLFRNPRSHFPTSPAQTFFSGVGEKTPAFVRFSTVAGSKGSFDLARDVRGFAVKLYTKQGNWDIVGNNIPVFFIQDAIKFPDLIYSVKPEPDSASRRPSQLTTTSGTSSASPPKACT